MSFITKRELNQHTAAALEQVTAQDSLIVTERGRARWRVTVVYEEETPVERLGRKSGYTPPKDRPAPWPDQPGGPAYRSDEVDALLDDLRGDH